MQAHSRNASVSQSRRRVYSRADLVRLLEPESIAIVGASPKATSFGARTLANLEQFAGRIHLVNAKYASIGDRPCHRSLADLPESPDCVVIAVAREFVEPLVQQCVSSKVGGIVIYASGYAETGKAERMAQQARLTAIAHASGIPIVGPNVMGEFNFARGALVSFVGTLGGGPVREPAIGVVSQSGALGLSLGQAAQTGVSISHVLLSGNSCDFDVADAIAYLAEDPSCQAIACVFEGMPDPLRLLEAGELAMACGKPVVVYKIGTGEMGAAAAVSHTGSLAGSSAAYRALFERVGMAVVDNFEDLIETAAFFAKLPALKAKGVAVVSASGGAGIMAADKAELHGVPLPQPNEEASKTLVATIPEFGSPRNPCDVTAQIVSRPDMMRTCADALLGDPGFGTLVVNLGGANETQAAAIAMYSALARQHAKLVCITWSTQWNDGPGSREAALDPNVALFRSHNRCFAAIAAWHRREDYRGTRPRQWIRLSPPEARQRAAALIQQSANDTLTEREAKAVLALYGVPVTDEQLVHDGDAAVCAASSLGYPVALKVESPDITHKTEAGVIRLDLRDEADVRSAYDAVMANALRAVPVERISGVLIQPMVAKGVEIMVGGRTDAQFGAQVVVGLGGVMVELMSDTVLDLAPVTRAEARAMLDRLKGRKALDGFRGMARVDVQNLADVIARLSEFAEDQRELVSEFDVNPLICAGTRAVAVDALIVRRR
jgi:acyl-CoA synthetase (NDP forming)